jgi:hypothetical protein
MAWKENLPYVSATYTPQDAATALTFNTLPLQRKLRQKHVNHLTNLIKTDTHRHFDIAFAHITGEDPEKTKVMVNGQHSCRAIENAGIPVIGVIAYYECDNLIDIADVYALYDTDEKTRSINDIIKMHIHALAIKEPVATVSMTVMAHNENSGKKSDARSIKGATTKTLLPEFKFMDGLFPLNSTDYNKKLFKKPIVRMILKTWQINKKEGEIFWKRVRDGALLAKDSPELILRNFLLNLYWEQGKAYYQNKRISVGTLHKKIIHAWNSYRQNKTIKRLMGNESSTMPQILP